MKKIHFLLMTAFVAFGFAACSPNPPEEEATVKFDIKVTNITESSADIYCAAQPEDAAFSVFVLSKAEWEAETDKNALFQDNIDQYAEIYEEYKDDFAAEGINSLEDLLVQYLLYKNEVAEGTVDGLTPSTEYVIAAIAVDMTTYQVIETPTVVEFTTLEYEAVEAAYTINVTDITSVSAVVSITPNNDDAYYYWDVFSAEEVEAAGGATAAMEATIAQAQEYIDLLSQYGYEVSLVDFLSQGQEEYEYELSPSTDYIVIAATVHAYTGEIMGQPATHNFSTEAYVMPEDASIAITVTDLTSTTATVTCTPADQTLNYYFDLLDKETFDALEDPVMAYLQSYYEYFGGEYTLEEIINDFMSEGTDGYSYDGLTPATQYVAFAKAYDYNQKAYVGETYATEFTTTDGTASAAQMTKKNIATKKHAPAKVGKTVTIGKREITIQKVKTLNKK